MSKVLTVYNHGTGATSEKPPSKMEIVNLFGNADPGLCWSHKDARVDTVKKFITEGVGSSGSPQDHHYRVEQDGRITHHRDWKAPKVKVGGVKVDFEAGPNLARTIFGSGVGQNVHNFLNVIKGMLDHRVEPDIINMIGWSRGAVTCIRQAYRLWQLGETNDRARRIRINIFAVDPVAGPYHNHEVDAITLMPNVKNYIATLARTENRSSFQPVSPITDVRLTVNSRLTRVAVLPFPGIHADLAKYTNSAGMISFNLCQRFLKHHGSNISKVCYQLPNWRVAEHYAILRRAQRGETHVVQKPKTFLGETYFTTKNALVGGVSRAHGKLAAIFQGGEGRRQLNFGNGSERFFVNAHDRATFAERLPVHYIAYFGAGRAIRNTSDWELRYKKRLDEEWQHFNRFGQVLTKSDKTVLDGLRANKRTLADYNEAQDRQENLWDNGLVS